MTANLPRLREDLNFSRQTGAAGTVFVVKDPIRSQFFRFPEEAHFIASQLDGATPLEEVRRRAEEEFRTPVSTQTVDTFVGHLAVAGLLENGRKSARPTRARRIQGNLLNLRIRFFDPDRLFNFLIPRIRFLFTPGFFIFSAMVILTAVWVVFATWEDVTGNLSSLYQLSAIPLVIFIIFLVIAAHEFAHGLTCKHFGGEVHELGFLLIYFQPALYCNVSDAWLFPEKSKRLWVGFAGPWFELFIWALATLAWRVTDVETSVNYIAFIVMTSSGIKTLFNFNPLIKLDGYYLLSDWLEIPNLRKRAFTRFSGYLKHLFGSKSEPQEWVSARERRICLVYGAIAGIGSFALLAVAIVKMGGYLLEQSQPLAFLLFTGLLGRKVSSRVRRLLGKPSKTDDPFDEDDLPSPPPAAVQQAAVPQAAVTQAIVPQGAVTQAIVPQVAVAEAIVPQEPAKPAEVVVETSSSEKKPSRHSKSGHRKRKGRTLIRVLLLVLAAGALWLFLLNVETELRIKGPFDVLPVRNADVRAAIEGIIEEILVDEGDVVEQGALIARLTDRDIRSDLLKIQAQLAENRARLRLLEAGSRREEIQLSEAVVARMEEQLKFSRRRMERDKILYEQQLLSLNDYEDSARQVAACTSDLGEARKRLDILRAGSRPEEIEAMKAGITSFETQARYLEEQLRLMQVVSPASGIVATPARQLMELKHQLIKKGDLIAKVVQLKTITGEMAVSERDIADVKVGQKVILKARAYPELTFCGKVTSIATVAQVSSGSSASANAQAQGNAPAALTRSAVAPKTVLITTEIENDSLLLKPEMTGQCKIFCGQRTMLDIVTRRIARTVKVEFWAWW